MSQANRALSAQEEQFIENLGMLIADGGLQRSVGRVLGLLLLCEPRHQSADDVRHALQLSTGSVSSAMTLLTKIQLVERITFPGDRRFYYQMHPDCWQRILQGRILQAQRGIAIADEGLALHGDNDRLHGMRELYDKSIIAMDAIKLS